MADDRYAVVLRFFSDFDPEDEGAFIENLPRFIAELLDAERASVFLLSADMSHLSAEAALGVDSAGIRIDKMAGLAGWVFKTGESLCVDDAYADPRFLPEVDGRTGFKTRSVVCVPVTRRDGTRIGVLQALNRRVGAFGRDEEALLEATAAQVARVVLSMRRYRYLREATRSLREEHTRLLNRLRSERGVAAIVGVSAAVRRLRETVLQVAASDATVVVTGESGTGKELVARALHYESGRAGAEFVAVNCAAVPQTLLEAELFGVERGAATGVEQRPGKFELAAGGTLLLDEIGDMPAAMQAKLLRVLQERRVTRIGATTETPVDVRVVSATNRDLRSLMASGAFREDLFWRLCVIEVHVPPLRERPEDIPVLGRHFLASACKRLARRPLVLSSEAERLLAAFHWPGNVRQLQNEVERLAVLVRGDTVLPDDLSDYLRHGEPAGPGGELNLARARAALERRLIREALAKTAGNRTAAARMLGISREALRQKMRKLGMNAAR